MRKYIRKLAKSEMERQKVRRINRVFRNCWKDYYNEAVTRKYERMR